MGYVIPSGYARVTFEYLPINMLGSAPVWGIGVAADPDDTILDLLDAWNGGYWNQYVSEAFTLQRIVMRNDTMALERAMGVSGDSTAADCQPQVCALAKLTSGLTGRMNRGRIYFPGVLREANVNGAGRIDTSAVQDLQDAFQELVNGLVAASAAPVILHSTNVTPTAVTGGNIQQDIATQRRRMRG